MSDTRDGKRSGDGKADGAKAAGAKADGATIIDAKVEPIRNLHWTGRHTRIAVLLVVAIVISIAVAVVVQLASTGRLDLATLTGASSSSSPVQTMPVPAKPAPPNPGAIAAKPATAPVTAADAALAKRVDDLDRRLAALTDGLDRLQQLPSGEQAAARVSPQQLSDLATGLQGQMQALMQGQTQALNKRLDALEQAVAALQSAKEAQAADRIVVQQRMDEFDARLRAAVDNRAAALRAPIQQLLAWSELRDHARRGLPFASELPPLRALAEKAGGDAGNGLRDAVAALQPFADSGAPTQVDLLAGFPSAAEKQAAAFRAPDETATAARPWWQRAFDKVAGLVSIRRVGAAADAATPEGKLEAAGAALHGGNLAGATAALDGMTLVPALADWRRQAETRLQLDAALEKAAAALQAYFAAP
ncbi:COG4223 family protein [Ferrovibrio xuzhouensis]|uniref:Uroporphyrin-3 C-methyltransferase n=1 Tax=Ferrovibrio xuzhouensis TaxID=1576914 RepID=A0ABV7VER4_9PROT